MTDRRQWLVEASDLDRCWNTRQRMDSASHGTAYHQQGLHCRSDTVRKLQLDNRKTFL